MWEVKTLLVEDDDAYGEFELEMLRRVENPRYTVERVVRLRDAEKRLADGGIDLVLLDLFLPDSSGLEALVQIHRSFPSVTIVVVTGMGDEEMGIRAIQEGAQDYLLKDQMNPRLFTRVLLYAIERKRNEILRLTLIEAERKARAEAEHAIQIRDEFLLIANHELKTPLTCLRLQIQVFEKEFREAIPPELARAKSLAMMFSSIDRSIGRLSVLMDTLMDLSQFQTGQIHLKKTQVNLIDLVNEVILRIQTEVNAAGCSVRVLGDSQVSGWWDPLRFEEVITNLLMNAVKYAPRSPIEVKISGVGDYAQLEVRDEGPGISDEAMGRIFNRFERAEAGKGVMGLGLGLYLAQQIVRFHGGVISVHRNQGKGVTFVVRLPKRLTEQASPSNLKVA